MFITFFLLFSGLSFLMISNFYLLFLKEIIFDLKSISLVTRGKALPANIDSIVLLKLVRLRKTT